MAQSAHHATHRPAPPPCSCSPGARWRATSAPASCACWSSAVMLAVAALTAVGFFADRINTGLTRDARQLLGGDAIVASDQPAPPAFAAQAAALGLRRRDHRPSRAWAAPPTTRAAPRGWSPSRRSPTATRCAASCAWPTRRAAPRPRWRARPSRGTVWVDAGAARRAAACRSATRCCSATPACASPRSSSSSPTAAPASSSFAPRVMLNQADLPATGLIQPASRVTYRLAVASPQQHRRCAGAQLRRNGPRRRSRRQDLRGLRVESLASGRPEMRQTLDRAEKFLNLVALLAALLAAVAVGIAARDFASRHLDDCAMLRVLGQPQRTHRAARTCSSSAASACWPALAGVALGFACTTSSCGCSPGWSTARCRRRACGRRCSAWAWA